MGAEVPGVPGGPPVARVERARDPRGREAFGPWFQRERDLRGITLDFVCARTKLPSERIREIEAGAPPLESDGRGRAIARALARAIGADPDEASSRVLARSEGPSEERAVHRERWVGWGPVVAAVVAALFGAGILAAWLAEAEPDAASPEVVYRRDYVRQLIDSETARSESLR